MNQSTIIILLTVAALFFLVGCSQQQSTTPYSSVPVQQGAASTPSGGSSAAASPRVRLQDTQYAQFAYLISDNQTSPAEEAALAGFQVVKEVQSDGSLKVTLKALQPEYQNQSYVVLPGEKLYFIEASMGDDRGNHEYSLRDDTAVLTDSDGYIVSG
jgi:hypothetical protein